VRLEDGELDDREVRDHVLDRMPLGKDLIAVWRTSLSRGEAINETGRFQPSRESGVEPECFLVAEQRGLGHVEQLGLGHAVMMIHRRRDYHRQADRFGYTARPRTREADMTSQGTPHGRFTRAIKTRNLFQARIALREMQDPPLLVALDYLALLAELEPARFPAAALRWHDRLRARSTHPDAHRVTVRARRSRCSVTVTPTRSGYYGRCSARSAPLGKASINLTGNPVSPGA
jgi:hypothetical protein